MSWDQLIAPGVTCEPSSADTARFGLEVHRLTVGPGHLRPDELTALVEGSAADVLIVRYDAARQEVAAMLTGTSRAVLPAGALTYWEKPLGDVHDGARTTVVSSTALDTSVAEVAVRSVVRASFTDYGNHYTADPLLNRDAALEGYEEWAVGSLLRNPDDVLVQLADGVPIGVPTLEQGAAHVEVLLAGLAPSAQGHGLYGELLAAVERRALAAGLERLVISTQVHNIRVQRAWARRGLRPFAAVETVHLVAAALRSAVCSG